jgi:hypothetical protein
MIDDALLGLGLVAVIEGLAIALAPGRLASLVDAMRGLGPDRLRAIGLASVALGVWLVWLARG